MAQQDTKINAILIGSVGSGKSTLAGHLLYRLNQDDRRSIEVYENEANTVHKRQFKYSFIFRKMQDAKRPTGFTTLKNKRNVAITTAAGQREFIKEMTRGSPQVDTIVLVLPADPEGFEGAFSEESQSRLHTLIASSILEYRQFVVVVNRLEDSEKPEERYAEIVDSVTTYFTKLGHKSDTIPFVPVSAYSGDNMVEPSDKLSWYKGWSMKQSDGKTSTGKTLAEIFDALQSPAIPLDEKPLRFSIEDVHNSSDDEGVLTKGHVEYGLIKPGMRVSVSDADNTSIEVTSIESKIKDTTHQAVPGDTVGLLLKNITQTDIKRGQILGDVTNDSPKCAQNFTAQIFVHGDYVELKTGTKVKVFCHNSSVTCKLDLVEKTDPTSLQSLEKSPKSLKSGEAGMVRLSPSKPFCVESLSDYPSLARFTLGQEMVIVAVGGVKVVEKVA